MASLYHAGLVHGFFEGARCGGDLKREVAPPDAVNFIRIDLTSPEAWSALETASARLVETLRTQSAASNTPDGYVAIMGHRSTWTEMRRTDKEGLQAAWAGLHVQSDDLLSLQVSMWAARDQQNPKAIFRTSSVRVSVVEDENGAPSWRAQPGSLVLHADDLKDETFLARYGINQDEFIDDLAEAATVAFQVHTLDLYGALVAETSAHRGLNFSEQRALLRRINPGQRKAAHRGLVVREVNVHLTAEKTEREAAWVEFDPLAQRRSPAYSPKRQHEVSAFVRVMKKSGKVVPVRAHKRGDPTLGEVRRMKNVVTAPSA